MGRHAKVTGYICRCADCRGRTPPKPDPLVRDLFDGRKLPGVVAPPPPPPMQPDLFGGAEDDE